MNRIEVLEHDRPVGPQARTRLLVMSLAIALPPTFWNLQLLLLSSFANYACFPQYAPLPAPIGSMLWVHSFEYAFDLLAIAVAVLCGFVSLAEFRRATAAIRERPDDTQALWHLNRRCFMALGGMLSSGGFLVAILFQAIVSIMVAPCAGSV